MISQTRLLLSSLILCSALVACSDSDNKMPEAANTEQSVEAVASTMSDTTTPADTTAPASAATTQQIKEGMSEQDVTNLLGKPTLTQTHTLDTLTITHSEWTNESGTTSVQFQNGTVQYVQFIPTTK